MEAQRRAEQIDSAMKRYKAIADADAAVSQTVSKEVNEMENELRHIRETRNQLGQQVQRTRQDMERSSQERKDLERRLEDSKERLADIREDRRATDLDGVSMKR